MELANIYSQVIIHDVIYSFTAGLEQKLFRQAFYKVFTTKIDNLSENYWKIDKVSNRAHLHFFLFEKFEISGFPANFDGFKEEK